MSVPVGVARIRYIGSGSTGPYAFNYVLYDTSHLKVIKTNTSGVDTVLTLTTHYSVSIASDFTSATVTLVTALAGDGIDDGGSEILTITRDPAIAQPTEWPRNDPFPSRTHERAADLAVMMIGRLSEQIRRSILLPESSVASDLKLPTPDALKFLRWNAGETALENMDVALTGALAVSAFIQSLLDDVDAATARATIGALASSAVSAFMLTLLDDANAATARATLGVVAVESATESAEGIVELATDAEIRSAAIGTKAIMSSDLETASASVALSDAATVTVDWDTGINFTLTVTANRIIGNPTNGQPGTWRTILVKGNDATNRTITFGAQYLGDVPVITTCNNTHWFLLSIFCITASHFVVNSKRALG